MGSLNRIQELARKWRAHNFPDNTPDQQFLGMTEELGELAHALLKWQQGIRGLEDEVFVEAIEDGLGDLFIFAMGFADHYGIDLEQAIEKTWAKVSQRDWVADPQKGGES